MIVKSHTGPTDEINCFFKKKVLMMWEFFCLPIFCPNKRALVLKVIWAPFLSTSAYLAL